MRFSLQDVKKSIQRHRGELSVSLHFLRLGEMHTEIEHLVAYYESLLGQPQRLFSLDDARACVGDYRLAHCLIATLSNWYSWRQREWTEAAQGLANWPDLSSPTQLRLALYQYVNVYYQGFLDTQTRVQALQAFAATYNISISDLEYLLVVDSEDEAILVCDAPQAPRVQEIATCYNQWAFESALFNASSVRFVIDCHTFAKSQALASTVGMGVGAAIKRLCYLAKLLGVYYDFTYDSVLLEGKPTEDVPSLLTLTLYGPQDVTGLPQQYGLRLARLCRILLGYSVSKHESVKKGSKASFSTAIVEAEATVHFLQRSYRFIMGTNLLQLLPPVEEAKPQNGRIHTDASSLFDSSIEQSFAEAFMALAASQGVDGWRLEREPEPLLLTHSIFIPDFALTRGQRRIYIEILGFWTPAYRERKVQKLQQLQGRDDLLLAIPIEAKDAFASIAPYFPIVVYHGQLSVTDVLQELRHRYDDFAERMAQIDLVGVRERVRREGLLPERDCYEALHCYRRSELLRAAEQIVDTGCMFLSGVGIYDLSWMERLMRSFIAWISVIRSASLQAVLDEIRGRWSVLRACEDATIEALLGLWPEVLVRRDSIFDVVVEYVNEEAGEKAEADGEIPLLAIEKETKKPVRERRTATKKPSAKEKATKQGDLWG